MFNFIKKTSGNPKALFRSEQCVNTVDKPGHYIRLDKSQILTRKEIPRLIHEAFDFKNILITKEKITGNYLTPGKPHQKYPIPRTTPQYLTVTQFGVPSYQYAND